MEEKEPPSYITLDVEVISSENLTSLACHLEKAAFILGHQEVDGLFYLSLEPSFSSREQNSPEESAKTITGLLDSLPKELKSLWNRANSRVFDFGFRSGIAPPPLSHSLSPETLLKIASHGAGISITIYQHDDSPPEEDEAPSWYQAP